MQAITRQQLLRAERERARVLRQNYATESRVAAAARNRAASAASTNAAAGRPSAPAYPKVTYKASPPVAPLSAEERKQMNERALNFRMEQATNGLSLAQYNLANDYLAGTNGLAQDKDLATYWLLQSASQGCLPAAEKLKEIKPYNWEILLAQQTNSADLKLAQ